jgi:hypothetical protein
MTVSRALDEKSSGAIAFFLTFLLLFVSRQKENIKMLLSIVEILKAAF